MTLADRNFKKVPLSLQDSDEEPPSILKTERPKEEEKPVPEKSETVLEKSETVLEKFATSDLQVTDSPL